MTDGPGQGTGPGGDGSTGSAGFPATAVSQDPGPEVIPGHSAAVRGALAKLDTTVAHPARVYDYWLGGKDNFGPDREAAEQVIAINPGIVPGVRMNRAFLVRAVRHLAASEGIRQFLDLGTGLPSANNVHEVAQSVAPEARVVYVDNDPIVLVHAHALLTGTQGTVNYIDADIRDPGAILRECARTLDLTRPVALLLLMTLQFLPDDDEAHGVVSALMDALPSGSFLVVSHPATDERAGNQGTARYNQVVSTKMVRRSREEVSRFFAGLELLAPGVVYLPDWRPEDARPEDAVPPPPIDPEDEQAQAPPPPSPGWCGVGRKP